jgi:hypothetical protein
MKNISNILVSLILLVATTGIVVNKHYSAGKLFSVSLYAEAESCCADGDLCGCCDVETDVAQLKTEFQASTQSCPQITAIDLFTAPVTLPEIPNVSASSHTLLPGNHSPPIHSATTTSLLQVFRL